MFIDLTTQENGSLPNFDICIVGGGAAGISLARKLSHSKLKIAILEAGGLQYEPVTQELYDGTTTGPQYPSLAGVRMRTFGGSTGHWAGQSVPLDELDFRTRSWVPNSGWPIPFSELSRYLPEASDICGIPVGGYRWSDLYRNAGDFEFPLDRANFEDVLFRYSQAPRRFGDYFRDELGRSSRITCFLHANVTEVVTDESGANVTHMSASTVDGKSFNFGAKRFILACGGIANSRLLLVSNSTNPAGVGNDHDLVGRYFMEHPNYDSGSVRFSDPVRAKYLMKPLHTQGTNQLRLDFKLGEQAQQQSKILNHSAFFVPANRRRTHMGDEVGYASKVWRKLESLYDRVLEEEESPLDKEYKLRVRLEQAPIASSRVRLGPDLDRLGVPKVQLDIRMGDIETRTIAAVNERIAKELGRQNLGRMRVDFDPSDNSWKTRAGWQIHHCGGTRMHDSPGEGVVDVNSKVHGVSNLYMAGSSVFPTSGHANPTLNLVALTLRLGDHLLGETV